jgi:anti-sigma regulatory factor (Ser/Thr protein kinase)
MAAYFSPFARFERQQAQNGRAGWLPADLVAPDVLARLHLHLRAGPQAAGEGRHALDRLDGTLDPDQLSELRLLVTELLTNSVRHGATDGEWITLDVEIDGNTVRVVVTDRGPGFVPADRPEPHPDRPGGWGLCLVDSLADRWGVDTADATSVWFELDRDGSFAAAA